MYVITVPHIVKFSLLRFNSKDFLHLKEKLGNFVVIKH